MNGQNIKKQDYEIEIERLQTTCKTLTSKASLIDDLSKDLEAQSARMSELENLNKLKQEECVQLIKENQLLGERNLNLTDMN